MEFNEKFIDENIGDLTKRMQLIYGTNVNLARISADLIDGIKPVQRRTLYCMYLKDKGKKFRKVAAITGDVLGKAHPHGNTSIDNTITLLAQEWRNNIPLIEGFGNFGSCHDEETYVMTKEGWKLFKDITKDDELMSVDQNNGNVIFEKPVNIVAYEYNGMMYSIDDENFSFAVTEDHNMIVYTMSSFFTFTSQLVKAKDLKRVCSIDNVFMSGFTVEDDELLKFNQVVDPTNINEYEYNGMVYCAEVPTYHTLVTKKNEKILISGNCSGDPAGASRYIQARLSDYSQSCFFDDFEDSVVDMTLSFNDEDLLPEYLPAKYPNIFLNGTLGIGYGQAVNIPSFNFREVVETCIMLMRNPNYKVVLIPDSTTGAAIVETNFADLCNRGQGSYSQRCTYEIDPGNNVITITSLPELTTAMDVREKIATLKEQGDLQALTNMKDLSKNTIHLELYLRNNANPYKFMKKLIDKVSGLERSYAVNITIEYDLRSYDWSIKTTLLEWIRWRRWQKRLQVLNRRSNLMGEHRILEIKLFIMNKENLDETINIFRHGNNRTDIEEALMKRYHNSAIHMDSLQARTLSNMRMIELSKDAYAEYQKRFDEVSAELSIIEQELNESDGIDKLIIEELKEGNKKFGAPRRSSVVPKEISVENEVEGICILQLSSDGNILRKQGTNVEEEPIPTDSNGFACLVDNDSSFIIIDDTGNHSFIKAKELPIDTEVPVARYSKKPLSGKIIAMLPVDLDSNKCCMLISKKGLVKRILINDIKPSKKPCISLEDNDKLVKGIILNQHTNRDVLVYTKLGYGQRLDPKTIRVTSPNAKGGNGFKISNDDEIVGFYSIDPLHNAYLLYVTKNGKMRLNNIQYLPVRNSKHDSMVRLIQLSERDKLVSVVGCNKLDKLVVFYDDNDSEEVDLSKMPESTMAAEPKKYTKKNAVTSNITKVKIM